MSDNVYNLKHPHVFIRAYVNNSLYEDDYSLQFVNDQNWSFVRQEWDDPVAVRPGGARVAV